MEGQVTFKIFGCTAQRALSSLFGKIYLRLSFYPQVVLQEHLLYNSARTHLKLIFLH